jgi:hypothetical protein
VLEPLGDRYSPQDLMYMARRHQSIAPKPWPVGVRTCPSLLVGIELVADSYTSSTNEGNRCILGCMIWISWSELLSDGSNGRLLEDVASVEISEEVILLACMLVIERHRLHVPRRLYNRPAYFQRDSFGLRYGDRDELIDKPPKPLYCTGWMPENTNTNITSMYTGFRKGTIIGYGARTSTTPLSRAHEEEVLGVVPELDQATYSGRQCKPGQLSGSGSVPGRDRMKSE